MNEYTTYLHTISVILQTLQLSLMFAQSRQL